MKRMLIAVGAAGALCATVIAAPAAGHGGTTVYAPKDCTKPKVEPKRITLTCADDGARLKRLGWDTWNTDKVKGEGKLVLADCDPNCAEGGVKRYPVKVTLLKIKQVSCGGMSLPMYTKAHLRFPGKKPDDHGDLRSFGLKCNS